LTNTDGSFIIDRIVYQKENLTLEKIVFPDDASARLSQNDTLLERVKSFNLIYNPDLVNTKDIDINLTIETISSGRIITVSNSSKIYLRNR